MKKYVVLSLLALMVFPVIAQETDHVVDPAIQDAKEETAVVYDLGRFFGYVWRLQGEDFENLALTRDQMVELYEVVSYVASTARIEPDWAEEQLDYLELDLLSPAQLMQVDMFAISREESRVPGSGTGTGSSSGGTGTGAAVILSYINGGAFNPIIDDTKTTGQDFVALLEFLTKELGR